MPLCTGVPPTASHLHHKELVCDVAMVNQQRGVLQKANTHRATAVQQLVQQHARIPPACDCCAAAAHSDRLGCCAGLLCGVGGVGNRQAFAGSLSGLHKAIVQRLQGRWWGLEFLGCMFSNMRSTHVSSV